VHIAKVKSVNLDKWDPQVVEMYRHMSNRIANFYWEAQLPRNYTKPSQSASNQEIEHYIREKYINKRWCHPKMKMDPASLYKTDRKKFNKFMEDLRSGSAAPPLEEDDEEEEDSDYDEEEERKRKEKKKAKKEKRKKRKEEEAAAETKKTSAPPKKAPAAVADMISFDAPEP